MQLIIAAIGRFRRADATPWQDYLTRLPHGGQLLEAESKLPEGPARTKEESQKLLALTERAGAGQTRLAALDPGGRDISSEELAQLIASWRQDGVRQAVFAIGGADGHHQILLDAADSKLAFGRAIWPHRLFRTMLAEQLYRAEMILSGHPYHRS